jgi:uncharacterized protein YjiS (DUF1127 family)
MEAAVTSTFKLAPVAPYASFGPILPALAGIARTFLRALRNRRAASALAGLDERMLADIGLTRSDLHDAYAEPLWRDPTDILAHRARERRRHRPHGRIAVSPVQAPPLAPASDAAPANNWKAHWVL